MPDDKEKIVQTTIRMPVSLHRKLTDTVQDRKYTPDKTSIDALVQEAIRRHLVDPDEKAKHEPAEVISLKAATKEPTLGIPRADWHGMLDRILDSNANYLVMAIVTNLLAFGRDAETIGGSPGKSPARYERYEARVLRALAELMGPEAMAEHDPKLAEYARFLEEARESQRDIVVKTIQTWKNERAKSAAKGKPKDARKEKPDEGEGHGRKAV